MNRSPLYTFFLLFPLFLSAQAQTEAERVRAMFDKPSRIEWIQHYKGRIDDLNDIAVTLAYDGKNCKGQMTYLRSKERFDLDGSLQQKQLVLKEKSGKEVSGYIRAAIRPEGIVGEWQNADHSIGGRFHLHAVDKAIQFPSYCGDNKWIHLYKGVITPYASNLLLQKESNSMLRGVLFIQRENKSYSVQGEANAYGQFSLRVRDIHDRPKGILKGRFQKDQLIDLEFVNNNQYVKKAIFRLADALPVACVEFADFISSYDITYPKTNNVSYNRWMDELTDNWVVKCRNHSREVGKLSKNGERNPDLRASVRSFAWSELDLYDSRLISGLMTMDNSWMTNIQTQAINYDLVHGKEIRLEELFRENFDHQTFLDYHIKNKLKENNLYDQNKDFREWVKEVSFSHFTIRQEGLCFSTDFNAIYGHQKVLISFKALRPYLRTKQSPIAHLYQRTEG